MLEKIVAEAGGVVKPTSNRTFALPSLPFRKDRAKLRRSVARADVMHKVVFVVHAG